MFPRDDVPLRLAEKGDRYRKRTEVLIRYMKPCRAEISPRAYFSVRRISLRFWRCGMSSGVTGETHKTLNGAIAKMSRPTFPCAGAFGSLPGN